MPSGGVRPGAGRPRKDKDNEHPEFTSEQLNMLLESPHIVSVSRRSVSYTLEFKQHFWQRYCDGIHPVQIFTDAGLSVEILGKARANTLAKVLGKQKEKGLPFNEGREPHTETPEKQFDFPKPPRKPINTQYVSPIEVSKLSHQVAYLSQEMEFLKKIILSGKGEK
jgi:hypothetical protein